MKGKKYLAGLILAVCLACFFFSECIKLDRSIKELTEAYEQEKNDNRLLKIYLYKISMEDGNYKKITQEEEGE